MGIRFGWLGVLLAGVSLLGGETESNPFPEIKAEASAWKNLIEAEDFAAWKKPLGDWKNAGDVSLNAADDKLLDVKPGVGIIYNGPKFRTQDLFSTAKFGDIVLHVEFMVSKHSNSGVYFMGSYELQIYDSFGVEKDHYPGIECGGIYQRWDPARGKGNEGFEGHSPKVNVSRKPGEWQSFDVIFQAPKFDAEHKKIANAKFVKVIHNGTLIHENVELFDSTRGGAPESEAGPLRLQGDHGPIAFRNLRVLEINKK